MRIFGLFMLLAVTACTPPAAEPEASAVGMANPASQHCNAIGGTSKIVTAADGSQSGYCHLPDGRICEEWGLYRDKVCNALKP